MLLEFTDRHTPARIPGLTSPRFSTAVKAEFDPHEIQLMKQYDLWTAIIHTTYDDKGIWMPYLLFPLWPILLRIYIYYWHDTIRVKHLNAGIIIHGASLGELYEKRKAIQQACSSIDAQLRLLAVRTSYEVYDFRQQ